MHAGRLPRLNEDSPADLERPVSRRRLGGWLAASVLVSVGGGVAWALTRSEAPRLPPPSRGSLEWARGLLDAPRDEALAAAGDFERVVARYPDAAGLDVVARRILDLSLTVDAPHADFAAACAIRVLELLGDLAPVRARAEMMRARSDFVRVQRELDYVLRGPTGGGK